MITFSINPEVNTVTQYKNMSRLLTKVENGTIDEDLIGDSFIQIVTGKGVNLHNLRFYKTRNKEYQDNRFSHIIDSSEKNRGYLGTLENSLEETQYVEFEEESHNRLDMDYEVNWFIDMRYKLMFGYKENESDEDYIINPTFQDIWRLTELCIQGDKQAQNILRSVIDGSGYYKEFYEFFSYAPNVEAVASVLS